MDSALVISSACVQCLTRDMDCKTLFSSDLLADRFFYIMTLFLDVMLLSLLL